MANLKQIGRDETFSKSCTVTGKVAAVNFSFKPADTADAPRYAVTANIDFANVKEVELIELACRPVIIDIQRKMRVGYAAGGLKRAETLNDNTWKHVSVREMLDAETTRTAAPPVAIVKRNLDKLSAAERKEMIAALVALDKKAK